MQSRARNLPFFRWLIPTAVTLVFVALLGYKSPDPKVFSRYSYYNFLLLLTMGLWVCLCWWIVLDATRYHRFLGRVLKLSILSLTILAFGSLVILDFFVDLLPIFSLGPLFLAIAMWLLSTNNPVEVINRLVLVVSSVVIGFFVSELFFRFVLAEPAFPVTERQFVKTIASSWPRHISYDKSFGTYRILGVSDSYGRWGGHENYHYLLETLLQDDGEDVEVVNFSQSGYSPDNELETLRRFGARYSPDLVLHGFYVGNDFVVQTGVTEMHYQGIPLAVTPGLMSYRPRNSLLLQWLRSYIKVMRRDNRAHFSDEEFLEIERGYLNNFRLEPSPNERWQKTVEILDEIHREVDRMGAQYVIVIHPERLQIDNELRGQIAQKYNLNLDHYDFELPQEFLMDYCASRGILCLDLLPIFRVHSDQNKLYLFHDPHYSSDGNLLAANTIFNFLLENQLLTLQER